MSSLANWERFQWKAKEAKKKWGTVKLASKLSPTHISSIIGGDLQLVGLGCWRKRVQDRDTRSDFVIVSCHFDVCAEAVKQKLIPKLQLMEKAMFKRGLHTKWKNQAQPEFALISKNIQEPSAADNSQKVQLKQKLKHLKNALHVEYPVNSISRMIAVWKQLEEGGMLEREIGRNAALLEVGYRSPRSDTGVQQMLRAI